MKFGRPKRRLTKGVAVIGTATLVVAGIIVSGGTGEAVQAQLTQLYNCPFPLIGNQDVSVQITTEQPATVATGAFTPAITIAAVANAGATATQGLRLIGAETIEGSATATSTVTAPADQGTLTVQVGAAVPKQPIPPIGNDLVVNSSGSAPGLRFDKPGSATVSVTALELEMTPRKADGTPTDLGTFKSVCVLKAGQPTQLHAYDVTGAAVTPETIVGQGNVPPLKQVYTCPFPLIGNQDVSVDVNASLPGTVKAGEFVPKFDISAVANAGTTATQGLRLIGAETVEGSAKATSLVNFPGGHLAVQVPTDVPKQTIPPVGNPLITNASGSAPALRFDNPGTATLSVHDLILTLTPRRADGTPTDLGTFTADCTLKDGQTNVLHTFTIQSGADTQKPSAPTNLTAGTVTATSVPLSWTASTDNVGVTGYDVFVGGEKKASVTGTSATVDGLTANTEFTFTVTAKDAAGNVSDPSAPLTVRTGTAPDTEKPSVPTNLAVTGATETSIALSWTASTDNVGVTGYDVFVAGEKKTSVTGTTATIDGLTANTEYTFTVSAKDAAGNVSDQSAPATGKTLPAPDREAPSVPANLKAGDATASSIALSWDASTDNVGVTAYNVFVGGELKTTVPGTSATIEGLAEDTEYTFTVSAKDAAGNESGKSAAVTARTLAKPDTTPPTAPGNLRATSTTETSIALAWDASADNVGVVGYEVRGSATMPATGTTATITGLTPDTEYTFTVVAKDAAGNVSPASAAVTARTKPRSSQEIPFAFDLTGKTFIKAANGSVPLRGGISVLVNLGTGTFNGDLTLAPTQGNFRLFGFIPVSAKIEFVQAFKTVGTISPDFVLNSKSSVTVKLPRVSVFGFPISTSPTCQTKTPAEIPLASKPGFNPQTGGTLTGTYTLPALKGCGPLNNLISAVTAGPGNTIEVNLVPKR